MYLRFVLLWRQSICRSIVDDMHSCTGYDHEYDSHAKGEIQFPVQCCLSSTIVKELTSAVTRMSRHLLLRRGLQQACG
jgi:hypothetical protein